MGEISVILLLALIFLGPKKLPELASGLGKLIREIRKTTSDVKNEIQLDEAIRKPLEELREAVTLHPEELKRRDRLRKELDEIQRKAQESVASIPATEGEQGATQDLAEGEAAATTGSVGSGTASDRASSAPVDNSESMVTPPPSLPLVPAVPETAPTGTVARDASGATAPPAPPLAAVLAKGSGPVALPERRTVAPPTGSDFLRSLRAVPASRKAPHQAPVEPAGAADRSNITQNLSEADLAAVTVTPTPPPPPPPPRSAQAGHASAASSGRKPAPPPSPVRLPGATPPKTSND
jgi:Sec-independent protein translocase protein TatA